MKNIYLILLVTSFFSSVALAFDNFNCTSSNPPWLLNITETKIRFQIGNKEKHEMTSVAPQPAENIPLEHLRIYRTSDPKNPIIIIQNQSCSTGNSDSLYQYEGLIITPDKVFHGCCSKKLMLTR